MRNELAQSLELALAAELPTRGAVEALCAQAKLENCRSIALPSSAVLLAQHFLEESSVKISCRIGFPDGAADPDVKRYETELAIDAGAHEIELIPSLARISDGDYRGLLREIRDAVEAADERPVKVAADLSRWPAEVLREVVQVVLDSGAQYICADEPGQVALLREWCGADFGILAMAERREEADVLLELGANLVSILG